MRNKQINLCVDACKAKGMNENSKGRYTPMNQERRGRNEKQKYCMTREEKREGDDKFVCVCGVCACVWMHVKRNVSRQSENKSKRQIRWQILQFTYYLSRDEYHISTASFYYYISRLTLQQGTLLTTVVWTYIGPEPLFVFDVLPGCSLLQARTCAEITARFFENEL